MPRTRHTVEQIISKLREAEVAIGNGQPIAQTCRTLGITEQKVQTGLQEASNFQHGWSSFQGRVKRAGSSSSRWPTFLVLGHWLIWDEQMA